MAKRPSRAQERQRLIEEAAAVRVPSECDVAVIGGGAAGLVAAITAAEAGASVTVFEQDLTCGKPILATGNGRCNFANVNLDPKRFNDPSFVEAVCGDRWLDDVLAFFRESGMRWCLEDERLYPMSRSSASVRNVLLARARRAGVILAPGREVAEVSFIEGSDYPAELCFVRRDEIDDTWLLPSARTVILATGGEAFPFIGNLGLMTAPRTPVLCPVACEDSPLSQLDGRRAQVRAYLTKQGSFFPSWNERGEALFRTYGLSGIVTFDLSRRAEKGDFVELDLVPDLTKSQVRQLVDGRGTGTFEPGCLDGILDPLTANVLETLARKRWHVEWPEREEAQTDADTLVGLVKALPFVVSGLTETNHAQVTRGGLLTQQFDPASLGSLAHPWFFACGEALDIDADCGGFNLSWAWKSGMVAGKHAAHMAATLRSSHV